MEPTAGGSFAPPRGICRELGGNRARSGRRPGVVGRSIAFRKARREMAPARFRDDGPHDRRRGVASNDAGRLKAWWFYRMLFSPDPLGERLTLLWHNHFATSNRKVHDLVSMRRAERAVPKARPGALRRIAGRGGQASGDAGVARCRLEPRRACQRKPGPRVDGAVHAGHRPLHRSRRERGGAGADGWSVRGKRFSLFRTATTMQKLRSSVTAAGCRAMICSIC